MSTILNILYMGLLFSFETVGWPLYGVAVIHTTANSLFFSAYHTDFSKIKKSKHAGKELGHMSIVQRLGGVAGPLLGGLLAGLVDPRASVGVAAVLLVISLVPLFKTNEPVRTHQTITYKGLFAKIQPHSRNILALSAQNVGSIVPHIFWSFFIALTIFSENTYASLGLLVTASVFISLFISRQVGHYADKGYGAKLLRLGVGADILLGLSRLVINSAGPAVLHNLAREQTVPVRSIPITKGFYDESDQFPGQRIAYIITVENIIMFVRTLFLAVVLVLMSYVEPLDMLRYGSVAASIVGVLAITERYRALR